MGKLKGFKMKWIVLSLIMIILPVQATQQYTESSCILLKQQVSDYKRRLGKTSNLYAKTKSTLDTHCQNPIEAKPNAQVPLTNKQVQPPTKPVPIKMKPLPESKVSQGNVKPLPTQPNPFVQFVIMLAPMFLLLFLGLMALHYFKKKLPAIKGRIGEKHVINGLKKHLDETKYTIINDVTLPLEDGGTTQIDHIVVSTFGMFVIETKNMSGWIFGNEKQAKWTQTIHRSKYPFQNPLRQHYKHTKTLSHLLDMPYELFHSVIVFTPNAELKTKMPKNVGYLEEMMAYIKSFEQEKINHKLKLRVLTLIDAIKLEKGRKTNKQHVKYLKEEHGGKIDLAN